MSSIRDFIPLQKLGQGTFSNVYKVKRTNDQQIYGLKKVKLNSLSQKEKENALNQVRILASLQSQYIVGYKQAFFDQNLNVLCVVMQYADDGDLHKYIQSNIKNHKSIQQKQIWKAAQHVLKGLQHLHMKGILHRDIKCANVFKTKDRYKLGDLNVSKVNGDKMAKTQTGTPYYASPEVWRDQPYDSKSDIWSFGCIIYQMAALKPPFNGKDLEDLFNNIHKGKITPLSLNYSKQLWDFIQLCLQKDPKKRPTASTLLKQLKNNENLISSLKINNPQSKSNQLLKTIKLPNDMKKLNQALPNSKYKKNTQIQLTKQNKSCLILNNNKKQSELSKYQVNNSISKLNSSNSHKKQQIGKISKIIQPLQNNITPIMKQNSLVNKSIVQIESQKFISPRNNIDNSYKSPKARAQTNRLLKSPASDVRLGKKVESYFGYSQRLQKSDLKPITASKVQNLPNRMDYQSCIKQITQRLQKPLSIPRTQKKKNLINNSYLIEPNYKVNHQSKYIQNQQKYIHNESKYLHNNNLYGNYNQGYMRQNCNRGEPNYGVRNKLVKKTRILSSNYPKPSW